MEAAHIAEPVAPPANGAAPDGAPPPKWQRQRDGREFVPKPGGKGKIFRQGEETVEEARARDAIPADQRRPRRKSKLPPRASQKIDLKALEKALEELFKTPTFFCAMAGDEWGTAHFTTQAPALARNLINAAEHNPWLRARLEALASGDQMMMQIMSLGWLAVAAFMYAVPPLVYYMNLPLSDERRALLNVPPRRLPEPPPTEPDFDAAEPPPDQPAEGAFGAVAPAEAPAA